MRVPEYRRQAVDGVFGTTTTDSENEMLIYPSGMSGLHLVVGCT